MSGLIENKTRIISVFNEIKGVLTAKGQNPTYVDEYAESIMNIPQTIVPIVHLEFVLMGRCFGNISPPSGRSTTGTLSFTGLTTEGATYLQSNGKVLQDFDLLFVGTAACPSAYATLNDGVYVNNVLKRNTIAGYGEDQGIFHTILHLKQNDTLKFQYTLTRIGSYNQQCNASASLYLIKSATT